MDNLYDEAVRAALHRTLDDITPRPDAFGRAMAAVRAEAARSRVSVRPWRGARPPLWRCFRPLVVALLLSVAVGGVGAVLGMHGRLGERGIGAGGPWNGTTRSTPTRHRSMMAYDPGRGYVVMFDPTGNGSAQTSIWDGSRWHRQLPQTSPPPSRAALMAFDPTSATVILYLDEAHSSSCPVPVPSGPAGGHPSSHRDGCAGPETWSWDGNNWQQKDQAFGPPSTGVELALDPTLKSPVLLTDSGSCATTAWRWTGATWTRATTAPGPARSAAEDLITDPASGHLELITTSYSGYGPIGDGPPEPCNAPASTWQWNGSSWHEQPFGPPGPTGPFIGATDDVSGQIVVFTDSGETWTSDSGTWVRQHPRHAPTARISPSMVFDGGHHEVLLFGGVDGHGPLEDTWTWDGSDWTQE
jgi:hypothetical protein